MTEVIPGIPFPKNNLTKIDSERGDIARSRYLLRMIENTLHSEDNKGCKKHCDHKTISQDLLDSRFGSLQSSESRVPREDRPLMNQCKIPQEVNNGICEAVGCFSPAEAQIKVKVGQLGNISLSLCNICVNKFVGDDKNW
jgi:hypothetical protein